MAKYTITINHTKVAAILSSFPVYVNLNDVKSGGLTLAEAQSIRVYKSDGVTELAREIVSKDEMHFLADSLSNTADTVFIIDIDGVRSDYAVSATYGAQNVWGGYKAVWHLKTGSDSTANANDGTAENGVTIGGISGKLNEGTAFDGVDDWIQVIDSASLKQTNKYSVSIWVNPANDNRGDFFTIKNFNASDDQFVIYRNPRKAYLYIKKAGTGVNVLTSIADVVATKWTLIYLVSDGSTSTFYLDGKVDNSASYNNDLSTFATTYRAIGSNLSATTAPLHMFNGKLDEVRIQPDRTASWIATEYANQNSPSTFYAAFAYFSNAAMKIWNGVAWISIT